MAALSEVIAEKDKRIAELEVDLAKGEYEKTFISQQQRLIEARMLIRHIGWTGAERTDVVEAANKWLEGNP